jgi:RNA polymerase sigma-70 factor (ECF subfamily)
VLAFVRRHSANRDEAEDLTQGFFLEFLERGVAAHADPARGRFRNYLLAAVRHYLSNIHARESAAKRGGGVAATALADADELVARADPEESPERTFERTWALTVLNRASARLQQEAIDAGKEELFGQLREFLVEAPEPERYEALAQKFGMKRNTISVTVHRLRERLRELVRTELAQTVADEASLEAELRALRDVLARS